MAQKQFWVKAGEFSKKIGIVVAIIGSLTFLYTKVEKKAREALVQPFEDITALRHSHAVQQGHLKDLSLRMFMNKDFYIVLDDGIVRDAKIFLVGQDIYYVFAEDPRLGEISFRCYYSDSDVHWYFYEFTEDPYSIIYER